MGQCCSQEVKSNRKRQEPFGASSRHTGPSAGWALTAFRLISSQSLQSLTIPHTTRHFHSSGPSLSVSCLSVLPTLSIWKTLRLPALQGPAQMWFSEWAVCDSTSDIFVTYLYSAEVKRPHSPVTYLNLECQLYRFFGVWPHVWPAYSVFWSQMRHENLSATY